MILCTTYCTHNWYFAPWYVATFCKYISRKLSTMCCQTICVTFWKPIRQSFQRRPSHPNHHLWSPDYTLPSWPKPPGPTICGWQVNLTNPGEGIGGVSFTWLDCRTDLKLKKYCFQRRRFGPEDHLWKFFRRAPQKTTQMVWRTFWQIVCWIICESSKRFDILRINLICGINLIFCDSHHCYYGKPFHQKSKNDWPGMQFQNQISHYWTRLTNCTFQGGHFLKVSIGGCTCCTYYFYLV